ncbi:hypothetical protein GCM10007275_12190 [Jeotgalicoccus coquinae]|nr:hypothetical protein GCM10007275_12190 [Jeotgalicoccus coquinae]
MRGKRMKQTDQSDKSVMKQTLYSLRKFMTLRKVKSGPYK